MFKPILLLAALISLGVAAPSATQRRAAASATQKKAASAAPATPAAPATSFAQLPPDAQTKAKSIYKIDCGLCHGDDGNGQSEVAESMHLTMDNWTDGKVLTDKTDKALFDMIRNGKDKMPGEPADRATDAEVHNLVLYIRSLAKDHPDVIPASAPATPPPASGSPQMHP